MHDPLSAADLVAYEVDQRRESGYDVRAVEQLLVPPSDPADRIAELARRTTRLAEAELRRAEQARPALAVP